jgi:ATP-dependent HslUV protease ATP-binding subunit HslU
LRTFTPREIVSELDRYIVGQRAAKRAVAVALRNRWRRRRVEGELREEIYPKNILMIGPTGVGKTEIARRLAGLADAPFLKVEASKFTEVGYVGRDVESILRDLVEIALRMVKDAEMRKVRAHAERIAEERLLDALYPRPQGAPAAAPDTTRERLREKLRSGELAEREVEIETAERAGPSLEILTPQGIEELGLSMRDLMGSLMPKKSRRRRLTVARALEALRDEEAERMVDPEAAREAALRLAAEEGIVFIDEIDKIAGRRGTQGPDVSREGVQRDLLPLVEGCAVQTKHGTLRSDHVLFVAAGAFHVARPSDLIPELQGRFPIRVELENLGEAEFVRILEEPHNALTKQYRALLATEGVDLRFKPDAIAEIARVACQVNRDTENIGARRLHTLLERLLEDVSFDAPERGGRVETFDAERVRQTLGPLAADRDLSRYIL